MKVNKPTYTAKEILNQLDQCAKDYSFPMLDNGYVYLVTTKLTSYRDENRWAIIIEVVGFNYRGGGHQGITNCLYIFGNCLEFSSGTNNSNFLFLTEDGSLGKTFDEEFQECLNPLTSTLLLRNKEIQIQHNRGFYQEKGIKLQSPDKIYIWEFLRGLIPEYESEFFAKDSEIRARIPKDLPKFIELLNWNHPDCINSAFPSNNETFALLALSLESGNIETYKPTSPPNNYWSNWPNGGIL